MHCRHYYRLVVMSYSCFLERIGGVILGPLLVWDIIIDSEIGSREI